jgi:hypothetical protein
MNTVGDFVTYVGISPLKLALQAIDRHNAETVDVTIGGGWLTSDNCPDNVAEHLPIEWFRVRGISWGETDWEFCAECKSLSELDELRNAFHYALEEHSLESLSDDWLDDWNECDEECYV